MSSQFGLICHYNLSLLHYFLHYLHITGLKMDVDIVEEDKIRIITHLQDFGT